MSSTSDDSSIGQASQACASCRKQKRKCTKTLPSCILCSRLGRPCDYGDATDDIALLRQKVLELEDRLDRKSAIDSSPESTLNHRLITSAPSSTFPTSFFLDPEIYQESGLTVPRPKFPIPSEVLNFLGTTSDVHDVADQYFTTVHFWLPMVSRKRMQMTLSTNSLAEPSADLALLLLCMKLSVSIDSSNSNATTHTSLYWTVKSFFMFVESNAMMSIRLLQSSLLIAAYEIGHGIYPAAYLSSGHCARLVYALGLHDRKNVPQMIKRPGSWAEQEEMRRCWWATLLLDRYVNMGSEGRPLAAEDPSRTDVLPADDDLWDQGEMTTSEPLYVSSPTSATASPFARTCQATHLVGRLIRHLNDHAVEPAFRFSEALQLHRTLTALSFVLDGSPQKLCTATAMTFSSMMHLYDPYACTETEHGSTVQGTEMQGIAIAGLRGTAEEVVHFAHNLQACMSYSLASVSPLVADAVYMAAATFAWLEYERGTPEMSASLRTLTDTLQMLSSRWRVAGEYLKMLEMTRESLYNGGGGGGGDAAPTAVVLNGYQDGHLNWHQNGHPNGA